MDTGLISLGTFWGSEIANHLWQSTLFAATAWLLTLFFRKNRARVRYWIWVAVSIKFLIPFSLLVSLGGSIDIGWTSASGLNPSASPADWTVVQNINQPFSPPASIKSPQTGGDAGSNHSTLPVVTIVSLWAFGAIGCLFYWMKKNRYVSRVIRESEPLSHGPAFNTLLRLKQNGKISSQIRLASSKTSMEPGVFGIFRSVLLLPAGMTECLRASEIEAILEHEASHIRCRDNLVAAFHMFVQALFWFHPLVWWIGSKQVQEREKACDEAVLQSGKEPQAYAEGILKVCEFYVESPLPCVSGVIGSNLKKRIERIMTKNIGYKLSRVKKIFLTAMGFIALTVPLLIGILTAPPVRAYSQDGPKPAFEVASIKPTDDCRQITERSPGRYSIFVQSPRFQPGRFSGCSSLKGFMSIAYQVDSGEITDGPDWIDSANYTIEAKAEGETDMEVLRLMLQSLLEERFGLKFHNETLEKPVYALQVAEGGHKLKQAVDENGDPIASLPSLEAEREQVEEAIRKGGEPPAGLTGFRVKMTGSPDGGLMQEFTSEATDMQRLAAQLTGMVGRRVVDRTGLTGVYSFKMQSAVDRQLMGNRFGMAIPPGAAPPPGATPPPSATLGPGSTLAGPAPSADLADPSGPSVFTALKQQLGLKLEADKAPLEHIVVDNAERPSEN